MVWPGLLRRLGRVYRERTSLWSLWCSVTQHICPQALDQWKNPELSWELPPASHTLFVPCFQNEPSKFFWSTKINLVLGLYNCFVLVLDSLSSGPQAHHWPSILGFGALYASLDSNKSGAGFPKYHSWSSQKQPFTEAGFINKGDASVPLCI